MENEMTESFLQPSYTPCNDIRYVIDILIISTTVPDELN